MIENVYFSKGKRQVFYIEYKFIHVDSRKFVTYFKLIKLFILSKIKSFKIPYDKNTWSGTVEKSIKYATQENGSNVRSFAYIYIYN